ncbi:MAG: cytochrome C oxidase subunit IV family protein [Gammaproteobacteria bacterium]|nr:cytochrome C oxidase subunit IV family protein [Gammaproteobacteria bacterium]MBU1980235.1 cytochrome C oxidase subunit IV family protein [Gammaproteobacteria bacterium]
MTHKRLIDLLWLLLVALTLAGSYLGETTEPGLAITLIIALTVAIKGRIIVDHFMELKTANRMIRNLMRAYFYVLPLVIVLTTLFGDWLARLTTL